MYSLAVREYLPNVDKNEANFYTTALVNQYYMYVGIANESGNHYKIHPHCKELRHF